VKVEAKGQLAVEFQKRSAAQDLTGEPKGSGSSVRWKVGLPATGVCLRGWSLMIVGGLPGSAMVVAANLERHER
jgi:hypothetical protein